MDSPDEGPHGNQNSMLDAQIAQHNVELERKKREIFNARMDIIHSQGNENWDRQPINPQGNFDFASNAYTKQFFPQG